MQEEMDYLEFYSLMFEISTIDKKTFNGNDMVYMNNGKILFAKQRIFNIPFIMQEFDFTPILNPSTMTIKFEKHISNRKNENDLYYDINGVRNFIKKI